jgi:dihydroorotate dehydrogenase electron transfer subunit
VQQDAGELVEIYLESEQTGGRVRCPQDLIPLAGQYLLAHDHASSAPLPVPIFTAGSVNGGFLTAPPIPPDWRPGINLSLRGPLGRGFSLPDSARCAGLVALGETAARLKPLLGNALGQGASVVLVSDLEFPDLLPEVEVRPLAALAEVANWADYLAFDASRESLTGLRERLGLGEQAEVKCEAQVLVVTPMPCGGIAECGVCAVTLRRGWKFACKYGPVFKLSELI